MPTLCPYPQLFCGSNSYAQFFLVDANMLKEFLAIAITFESKNNEKVGHLSFYYSSTYKSLEILTQSIDKFRLYSLMSWICTKGESGALNTSTDLWSYVLPHESPWADTARHMGIIFTGWVEVTNKQHNANCTHFLFLFMIMWAGASCLRSERQFENKLLSFGKGSLRF